MGECRHSEMQNKYLRIRRNDITQGWGVLPSLISPSKGNENTCGIFVFLFSHQGTNPAKQGSTLLSGGHVVLSLYYSDSERIFFISKMRKGNKERKTH